MRKINSLSDIFSREEEQFIVEQFNKLEYVDTSTELISYVRNDLFAILAECEILSLVNLTRNQDRQLRATTAILTNIRENLKKID